MELKPIGIIHSQYKETKDAPRQGRLSEAVSEIEIFPEYMDGMKGIEKATHLIILYWGHISERDVLQTTTPFGPEVKGVFACRSQNRPNPIAFCVADLVQMHRSTLIVRGVDAIDGSFLLDIKPYSSAIDSVDEAKTGLMQENICRSKSKWEMSIEFHGHECMGLAIGYKQSILAMEELGVTRAEDEELFAIVETDACGVDAVQVVTGCTLGKGNLIYKDVGKQALTLANRKNNKAVRVIMKPNIKGEDQAFSDLRQKVVGNTANEEEISEWEIMQKKRIIEFLDAPSENLFSICKVPVPVIEKARLFKTVICAKCEEPFAEGKARLVDGKIVCGDCYSTYTRGW